MYITAHVAFLITLFFTFITKQQLMHLIAGTRLERTL